MGVQKSKRSVYQKVCSRISQGAQLAKCYHSLGIKRLKINITVFTFLLLYIIIVDLISDHNEPLDKQYIQYKHVNIEMYLILNSIYCQKLPFNGRGTFKIRYFKTFTQGVFVGVKYILIRVKQLRHTVCVT